MLLGAHTSISGGYSKAVERGNKLGCNVIQIFTRNQIRWHSAPLNGNEVEVFKRSLSAPGNGVKLVIGHASYLINPASGNKDVIKKSIEALKDELTRCKILGLPYYVLHPGYYLGEGVKSGIKNIAETLKTVAGELEGNFLNKEVTICIETMAGQGTVMGKNFEEIGKILETSDGLAGGVCFDTCHIFASGYDIRNEDAYYKTMDKFERSVGLEHIKVVHLNDSKADLGSMIDRHEHIGQGKIGLKGFELLLKDNNFLDVPKIIETPKGKSWYTSDMKNLEILRSLV